MSAQHKAQHGFLSFAINNQNIDYLKLSYLQALNIKSTQKKQPYAIIVDKQTEELITDKHRKVFDYIIPLPPTFHYDENDRFKHEPLAYWLTPFKETIKIESDLLFPRSIEHWWTALRLRDVVLSLGCKNYHGERSSIRKYRKFNDDNALPDVYNGMMYFRFSQTAHHFFTTARKIQDSWDNIKKQSLVGCREDTPSTDVLYAITAATIGEEKCTIPTIDFFNFVHMKFKIQSWPGEGNWNNVVANEIDGDIVRINNLNQYYPLHYYSKSFATDELIEYYEQRLRI